MRKNIRKICTVLMLSTLSCAASAVPVFVNDVTETSGWIDTNKTGKDDTLLCWAAAASNLLAYTGWTGGPGHQTATDIFGDFVSHWDDKGGSTWYGIDWWFGGQNGKQGATGWAQLTDNTHKGYYSEDLFSRNYLWKNLINRAGGFESLLFGYITKGQVNLGKAGLSLVLGWYRISSTGLIERNGGHALTLWGIDQDANALYVTDSDDRKNQLEVIHYNENNGFLTDYGYGGRLETVFLLDMWNSREGDPLPRNDVPEPSTAVLLMAGLAGLVRSRAKRRTFYPTAI